MRDLIDLLESLDIAIGDPDGFWITPEGEIINTDKSADIHHADIAMSYFHDESSDHDDQDFSDYEDFSDYDEGEDDWEGRQAAIDEALSNGWVRAGSPDGKQFFFEWRSSLTRNAIRALLANAKAHVGFASYCVNAPRLYRIVETVPEFLRAIREALRRSLVEGATFRWQRWWANTHTGEMIEVPHHLDHDQYLFDNLDEFGPEFDYDDGSNTDALLEAIYAAGWQAMIYTAEQQELSFRCPNRPADVRNCAKMVSRILDRLPVSKLVLDLFDPAGEHTPANWRKLDAEQAEQFAKTGRLPSGKAIVEGVEDDLARSGIVDGLLGKLWNYLHDSLDANPDFTLGKSTLMLKQGERTTPSIMVKEFAPERGIFGDVLICFVPNDDMEVSGRVRVVTGSDSRIGYVVDIDLPTRNGEFTTRHIADQIGSVSAGRVFRHEFQHVLDMKRFKDKDARTTADRRWPADSQTWTEKNFSDYFNSPKEFNAFFHNIATPLLGAINAIERFGLDRASHYKGLIELDFHEWVRNTLILGSATERRFWASLTAQNKRRALNRLYGLHKRFLDLLDRAEEEKAA